MSFLKNILSKRSVRVGLLLLFMFISVYENQRAEYKLKADDLQISSSCNLSNITDKYAIEIASAEDYVKLISTHNKSYTENLNLLKANNSDSCLLDIYNGYLRFVKENTNKCYKDYETKCSLNNVNLINIDEFLEGPNFSLYEINYYTGLKIKYDRLVGNR